jgi:hypothetical protein
MEHKQGQSVEYDAARAGHSSDYEVSLEPRPGVLAPGLLGAANRRAERILQALDHAVLERLARLSSSKSATDDSDLDRCLYNLIFLAAMQAAFPETNGIPPTPLQLGSFVLRIERVHSQDDSSFSA